MSLTTTASPLTWIEPAGISPRATVIVLAGRGETPEVYERFGKRLSHDAFRVVAVPTSEGDVPDEVVATLLADAATIRPVVLVGSDIGALHARRIADAHPAEIAAVVLAGIPGQRHTGGARDLSEEIQARTACPNHQRVLGTAARSALFAAPVAWGLIENALGSPDHAPGTPAAQVPVLAIHGEADTISPLGEATEAYRGLGATEVSVVRDGLHDVLNDLTHRSVAATIVLFLERVRLGDPGHPLIAPVAL